MGNRQKSRNLTVKTPPLVDNEGKVVGVITWAFGEEQYNGAKSLDAFCAKILKCEYEFEGEKTWWDYAGD